METSKSDGSLTHQLLHAAIQNSCGGISRKDLAVEVERSDSSLTRRLGRLLSEKQLLREVVEVNFRSAAVRLPFRGLIFVSLDLSQVPGDSDSVRQEDVLAQIVRLAVKHGEEHHNSKGLPGLAVIEGAIIHGLPGYDAFVDLAYEDPGCVYAFVREKVRMVAGVTAAHTTGVDCAMSWGAR